MNNPSSDLNESDHPKKSTHTMRFGRHQVQYWAVYLTVGIIAAVLLVVISTLDTSFKITVQPPVAAIQSVNEPVNEPVSEPVDVPVDEPVLDSKKYEASANLINKLKRYGLWKIHSSHEVPRFFIKKYPIDLNAVDDISIRKKVFLHSLLPHALLVRRETLDQRDRLESILGKIDCSLDEINFKAGLNNEGQCSWSEFLAEDEVNFIRDLCKNYRTTIAEELLERVDAVPTSIILAQGALESSWGSSRFTREGNSVFGMWTWKTKGMVPSRREEGKTHKVKTYESVLDSVRAYHLTLNRLNPYNQFRQLRRHTADPLIMAEGLTLYSSRGDAYVAEIKNVIQTNDLQKYDRFSLSDFDLSEISDPVSKNMTFTGSAKSSL